MEDANMETALEKEFGERVVTLCNGQAGLRSALPVVVADAGRAAGEDGQPTMDFVASDHTLDRDGEIIMASGWRLENYRKNPVFQNAHNYGNIVFTLGRALITEVRGEQLFQRILFATEINPMARLAYRMYRDGFLRAVSVGFVPLRWENGGEHAGYRRRYIEQELLENSAVAVPSNPNALVLAAKSGVVRRSDLRELHDLLQGMLEGGANRDEWGDVLALARSVAGLLGRATV